jgi:hypothetical protein
VQSVIVGDFNGDGKLDLVVADGYVAVLLGNGDGTFQAPVNYNVGGYAVAVGDFNGDGKLDLAAANFGQPNSNGSVTVLLGNGDGTFQPTGSYGVGSRPNSVAVGDFNGDGKSDLAVANAGSGSVSVLAGNGDGTFQPAANFGAGAFTNSVTVGDFNGDGKPDLAAANYINGNVSILINTTVFPKTATSTTAASSLNPSVFGQSVTLTAKVKSTRVMATGTVTFLNGTTTLGAGVLNGGIATYATSSLPVGQNSMTAVYSGDGNNVASTSAVLTQTVNAADFTLTSNPTTATVAAGQPGTFTLTVTPQGLFTSPINFSCSGLPNLAGCTFNPASLTPNTSTVTTTLTITTMASTASVVAPPIGRRSNPLYAIWLALPAMMLGTVAMAAPKRRKLLSCCLAFLLVGGCLLQAACGGGGKVGTPAGTYTVTITGGAGSTQHAAILTVTVQ